jgi:hypothetical protein
MIVYLPFGLRGACARSDAATVFSSFGDFLFDNSFPALEAGFLPVGIGKFPIYGVQTKPKISDDPAGSSASTVPYFNFCGYWQRAHL